MKKIITITMNPETDKSASVSQVIVERKLYCHSPRFEPGDGGINVSRAIRELVELVKKDLVDESCQREYENTGKNLI